MKYDPCHTVAEVGLVLASQPTLLAIRLAFSRKTCQLHQRLILNRQVPGPHPKPAELELLELRLGT